MKSDAYENDRKLQLEEQEKRRKNSQWAEETRKQCKEWWLSPYGRECIRKAREANFDRDNY